MDNNDNEIYEIKNDPLLVEPSFNENNPSNLNIKPEKPHHSLKEKWEELEKEKKIMLIGSLVFLSF